MAGLAGETDGCGLLPPLTTPRSPRRGIIGIAEHTTGAGLVVDVDVGVDVDLDGDDDVDVVARPSTGLGRNYGFQAPTTRARWTY
ncbi:MAG: hypothetical protein HYY06_25180 [Deltaproteobacteria bacterium]|nr:hypothetical protein [Deltaproteobacteria bacterium]